MSEMFYFPLCKWLFQDGNQTIRVSNRGDEKCFAVMPEGWTDSDEDDGLPEDQDDD